MAKFRKLYPKIWRDEKFRTLESEDKLLAIYCLASNQTNRIGLFCLSPALAAEEIGYPSDTHRARIDRVCKAMGWVYEGHSNVLFIPHWWRYNGRIGPKTIKGHLDDLDALPKNDLTRLFLGSKDDLSDAEGRVLDAYPIPIAGVSGGHVAQSPQEQGQEQEQEQEQEQDNHGDGRLLAGKSKSRVKDVDAIWEHYRVHWPNVRVLAPPVRAKIVKRLSEGFSVDNLKLAIDGNFQSPHHCGQNEQQTEYHGLELIVRDGKHVQQFIDIATSTPEEVEQKLLAKGISNVGNKRQGIEVGAGQRHRPADYGKPGTF